MNVPDVASETSLADLWQEALPLLQMSVPFDLESHTAVVFRVGSHAHGTYMPPTDPAGVDDVDLMVICVPPPQYVLGMQKWEHSQYKHGNLDVVFYDWAKWIRMVGKSNPNVVGTLWSNPEDVLFVRERLIRFAPLSALFHHRADLLSRRIYPAFVGYAHSQLHKMTNFAHQGYMGDKRKRLVQEFGYDVKNAAHLIRLLRMANEAIRDGVLNVRREDAETIRFIKQGLWMKEEVIAEAQHLFTTAHDALENSPLALHPDELLLQNAMVEGYREWWRW